MMKHHLSKSPNSDDSCCSDDDDDIGSHGRNITSRPATSGFEGGVCSASIRKSPGDTPLAKRRRLEVEFEPIRISSVGSVKEIDNKLLAAQHYKLCERFRFNQKVKLRLERRIEESERRQAQDDAIMCIVNRYWNRLDDNIQLLLQRFDSDAPLEIDGVVKALYGGGAGVGSSGLTTSLGDNAGALSVTVDGSGQAEKFDAPCASPSHSSSSSSTSSSSSSSSSHSSLSSSGAQHKQRHQPKQKRSKQSEEPSQLQQQPQQRSRFLSVLAQWTCEEADDQLRVRVEFSQRALAKLVSVFDAVVATKQSHHSGGYNSEESNNTDARLQHLLSGLQQRNDVLSMQLASRDDRASIAEARLDRMSNELEELRYELRKSMFREERLDFRLAEYVRKEKCQTAGGLVQSVPSASSSGDVSSVQPPDGVTSSTLVEKEGDEAAAVINVSKSKLEELQQKLESQTELASNRLTEIQEVVERNKTLSADLEALRIKIKCIPADEVKSSIEYQCLQSSYSALFEDARTMKRELEDLRKQLNEQQRSHIQQLEQQRIDEANNLDRMGELVVELEANLNTIRKEYDQLSIDHEQLSAAREQSGPVHEQVVVLMNSYCNQNAQLKKDVARFKKKWNDTVAALNTNQKELEQLQQQQQQTTSPVPTTATPTTATSTTTAEGQPSTSGSPSSQQQSQIDVNSVSATGPVMFADSSALGPADIQQSPQSSEINNNKEKLIRQLTIERDKLKEKIRTFEKIDSKERRRILSDEARRRVRQLEDQCDKLRRELSSAKQEEDGLMAEMESTGQAFEEMQEQNQKLIHQLREKDDINLKLMSERIRATQAQKKLKDEKELTEQQVTALENQLAEKSVLCQKLEEQERLCTENRTTLDQQIKMHEHANDALRRKTNELSQTTNELRLRLDRMTSQFNDMQENMTKKASSYEANAMKIKRLQEDKNGLKRKLERSKRMEKYENIDQLLQEENRQLKESLTCPSCKVNPKNAILTKCFHVFCIDCLKLRYDTRRRKCPKCNAAFGGNDYKRIYIE